MASTRSKRSASSVHAQEASVGSPAKVLKAAALADSNSIEENSKDKGARKGKFEQLLTIIFPAE